MTAPRCVQIVSAVRCLVCLVLLQVLSGLCTVYGAESGTKGDVTLRIWVSEITEDRVRAIRYLTTMYEALRDDVHVELVSVDEHEFSKAFGKSLQNGTAPCLVAIPSDLIVALGEKGYVDSPATSAAIKRLGEKRFFRGALSLLESGRQGEYYGIPFHGWIQGIWYREDWFREEGLEPPTSWKAILRAAEVLTRPDRGTYGILLGTKNDLYAAEMFTHLAISNNARMFNSSGKVVFNSPKMVETLEFYKKLVPYSPPGEQTWRARDYYMQGRLAMMLYSTFIMDDLALPGVAADSLTNRNFPELPGAPFDQQLVNNTRMVPLLNSQGTAGYGMVSAVGIVRSDAALHGGRGVDTVREAVINDFLDFLYSPDVYISWLHMAPGGMMPVFRDIAEEGAFMRDLTGVFRRYGRPKVHAIVQGLEYISNYSHMQGARQPAASVVYAENILSAMIRKALSGEMRCEQAVQWATSRINEEMDKAMQNATSTAPSPEQIQ